jgi:hypothetical protein
MYTSPTLAIPRVTKLATSIDLGDIKPPPTSFSGGGRYEQGQAQKRNQFFLGLTENI